MLPYLVGELPNDEHPNQQLPDKPHSQRAFKPNKVYHLAALFANQNSIDHPNRDLSVNGGGLINVLNGCVKNSVKRVVYTSSSCVYGNLEYMIEGKEGQLVTPYAITKLLGEQYLEYYSRQYGIEALSARLFNAYGPFDYPGLYRSVIPNFSRMLY